MVAGNTNIVATKAYCHRQYWLMRNSQLYWTLQNTWTYPSAQTYVERLFREAPTAKYQLQLAVITNITATGSSYHVAEELAINGGMHLILLGKKKDKLRSIEENLIKEAQRRGIAKANDPNYYKRPTIYKVQYDPNSIESILQAATDIRHIAAAGSSSSSGATNDDGGGGSPNTTTNYTYSNKISMLIHNPSGVTVAYKTTKDGMEINVGRNFQGPHVLTQQLLPQLREAAATTTFKPRIIYVVSVGHCQGTDFDPDRFLGIPSEGGSPEGTLLDPTTDEAGIHPLVSPGGNSGDYVPPTLTEDDDNDQDDDDNTSPSSTTTTTSTNNNKKVYVENKELDGPVTMYYRAALIGNAMALAKEEPSLAPMCVYPGSVVATNSKKKSLGIAETIYQKGFYLFNLSPSQAARATLRAAFDPDIDSGALPTGSYLHCDGNPWTVADPTVEDPTTPGVPYEWVEYSRKVRECALKLSDRLLSEIQQQKDEPPPPPAEDDQQQQPAAAAAAGITMTTTHQADGEKENTEGGVDQEAPKEQVACGTGDLPQMGAEKGDTEEESWV